METTKTYNQFLNESSQEDLDKCIINVCADIEENVEEVKRLILAGADVNTKDEIDWTPLHWAVSKSYVETCKLLIDAGADVNAKDEDNCPPLHNAAFWKNTEICRFLIEAGADLFIKDVDCQTSYDWCSEDFKSVFRQIVEEHGNEHQKSYFDVKDGLDTFGF